MRRRLIAIATVLLLIALPHPAAADLTAFIGVSPTADTRSARGFGVGFGLLVIGFEFEYANLIEDEDAGSP